MSPLPGDPMWQVSSRSGVATLRTAIHLLLTYLLTYLLRVQLAGVFDVAARLRSTTDCLHVIAALIDWASYILGLYTFYVQYC